MSALTQPAVAFPQALSAYPGSSAGAVCQNGRTENAPLTTHDRSMIAASAAPSTAYRIHDPLPPPHEPRTEQRYGKGTVAPCPLWLSALLCFSESFGATLPLSPSESALTQGYLS